jgi:hypothetical protein
MGRRGDTMLLSSIDAVEFTAGWRYYLINSQPDMGSAIAFTDCLLPIKIISLI